MVNTFENVLFQETQQFRQKWLWILLFSVCLLVIIQTIWTIINGSNEDEQIIPLGYIFAQGIGIIISLGLIYLFHIMKLVTEVRQDGLYIKFFPFIRPKKIEFREIKSCGARKYHPIKEYGGWGIRYGKRGRAYNVSGNQGVQLELVEQKPLLIGSQRAIELADTINSQIINLQVH